ncbi:helix-turn-helix domain-containing protein [Phenylobacterium sp.]|jgi:transcriptional regulator with XRE-family HTH domain|uniref:helix-turn-helix domain-containing protein n=1 Tax=Phenylobacterium sp. TaxID=1871053 RepID=UPI0037CAA077
MEFSLGARVMSSSSRPAVLSLESAANGVLDEIDMHIGRRVRRRRKLLGLTLQDLANACGVGFQQIQKYECAGVRLTAGRLWQLADKLQVPVSYFYQGLPGAEAASPENPLRNPQLRSAETRDLVQAYAGLDTQSRRCLLNLAVALVGDGEG